MTRRRPAGDATPGPTFNPRSSGRRSTKRQAKAASWVIEAANDDSIQRQSPAQLLGDQQGGSPTAAQIKDPSPSRVQSAARNVFLARAAAPCRVQFGGGEGLERGSLELSPSTPYRTPWICRRASPRWRKPQLAQAGKGLNGQLQPPPVKPPARSRLCRTGLKPSAPASLATAAATKAAASAWAASAQPGHGGRRDRQGHSPSGAPSAVSAAR